MTSFDTQIIQASFTEEEIREAKTLSAQSTLTHPAARVFRLLVDGYVVQVDGLIVPGWLRKWQTLGLRSWSGRRAIGRVHTE